jgi:hypothetical protein
MLIVKYQIDAWVIHVMKDCYMYEINFNVSKYLNGFFFSRLGGCLFFT